MKVDGGESAISEMQGSNLALLVAEAQTAQAQAVEWGPTDIRPDWREVAGDLLVVVTDSKGSMRYYELDINGIRTDAVI